MPIDDRISAGLERATRDLRTQAPEEVVASVRLRSRRRRQRRRATYALVAAGVLAATAISVVNVVNGDEDTRGVVAAVDDDADDAPVSSVAPPLEQPTAEALRSAWKELPSGPLGERLEFASAWTGSELIVWGGWNGPGGGDERFLADGAAYQPSSRTWRALPSAPGGGRAAAAAVWTGEEVVILGGRDSGGVRSDGLAYDPRADTWRTVRSGPLGSSLPGDAVWTGSEIVLVTAGRTDDGPEPGRVLAFDPASGVWDQRSEPPVAFNRADLVESDGHLFIITGELDALNAGFGVRVSEWDEQGSRWVELPPPTNIAPQAFAAERAAESLVIVDYQLAGAISAVNNVRWSELAPAPLDGSNCSPDLVALPGSVLLWQCGQAAIVDVQGRWINVTRPEPRALTPSDTTVVGDGPRILVYGRDFDARTMIFEELDTSSLG